MPFDFQPLTNFRLARGSHKQPNKDGNICVNEAAVIAAGFEYRAVRDVSCLPDCFSRPVSDYAIYLNDVMLHKVHNKFLMPFVIRLPGTSDSPWIEAKRHWASRCSSSSPASASRARYRASATARTAAPSLQRARAVPPCLGPP